MPFFITFLVAFIPCWELVFVCFLAMLTAHSLEALVNSLCEALQSSCHPVLLIVSLPFPVPLSLSICCEFLLYLFFVYVFIYFACF